MWIIQFRSLISYTLWRLGCLFDTEQASVGFLYPPPTPEKSWNMEKTCQLASIPFLWPRHLVKSFSTEVRVSKR